MTDGLVQVREQNPSNKLLQVRGQPGTHDVALSVQFFSSLFSEDGASREVLIPEFDNSEFNGEGDRFPEEKWKKVVISPESGIDVIVLEGWCVGFQPLDESVLEEKWKKGKYESEISTRSEQQFPMRTLQNHELSRLRSTVTFRHTVMSSWARNTWII